MDFVAFLLNSEARNFPACCLGLRGGPQKGLAGAPRSSPAPRRGEGCSRPWGFSGGWRPSPLPCVFTAAASVKLKHLESRRCDRRRQTRAFVPGFLIDFLDVSSLPGPGFHHRDAADQPAALLASVAASSPGRSPVGKTTRTQAQRDGVFRRVVTLSPKWD